MSEKRAAARIAAGELAATVLLVVIASLSGLGHAENTTAGAGAALLGSLAFGLGCGLVVATCGPLSGAQANPFVSVLASLAGGQRWAQTALRVVMQVVGCTAAAAVTRGMPATLSWGSGGVRPLAEGVAAFGFVLVAVGVAPRRNFSVPLALGAFATASFWMTGHASLGNPLVSVALAVVRGLTATEACGAIGASGAGTALGAAVSWFLFPQARASFALLVFAPRTRGASATRDSQH